MIPEHVRPVAVSMVLSLIIVQINVWQYVQLSLIITSKMMFVLCIVLLGLLILRLEFVSVHLCVQREGSGILCQGDA